MRISLLLVATFLATATAPAPYERPRYVDLSNFQFRASRPREQDQTSQQRHEFQDVKLRQARPSAYGQPAPQFHQLYRPPLQVTTYEEPDYRHPQVNTYEEQALRYPLQVNTYEEQALHHPLQVNTYEEQNLRYPIQVNTYEESDLGYPRYLNASEQTDTASYIDLPAPPLNVYPPQYEETIVRRQPYAYKAPDKAVEDQPSTWRSRLRQVNRPAFNNRGFVE